MLSKIKKNNSIIFLLIVSILSPIQILSKDINDTRKAKKKQVLYDETFEISTNWINKNNYPAQKRTIKWEKIKNEKLKIYDQFENITQNKKTTITALNRSIIFDEERVGPDISWMFPSGFKSSKKYKFDMSARGHNSKIPDPPNRNFFGWNDGDAVGLISYQFLHWEDSSFGINLGVRSIYSGDGALGGSTSFGEGMSAGFRWDYELSNTSGIAFGAEQLLHFDGLTDTGRNIYLTASKGWWSSEHDGKEIFPLYVATAGIGTGRMAIGTVRGLCTDLLGGSGTEISNMRNLCWAPVFSLASVWNAKLSTFFEYNGRFFLLGNSIAPFQKAPIRGTFALILSDHIDNYKFHDSEEINWVFQLSLGF